MAAYRSETLVVRGVRVVSDVVSVMARKGLGERAGKLQAFLFLCSPNPAYVPAANVPATRQGDADQRRHAGGTGRSLGFAGGHGFGWRSSVS